MGDVSEIARRLPDGHGMHTKKAVSSAENSLMKNGKSSKSTSLKTMTRNNMPNMSNDAFEIVSIEPVEKHIDPDDDMITYTGAFDATALLPVIRSMYMTSVFSSVQQEEDPDPDGIGLIINANILIFKNGFSAVDIQKFSMNGSMPLGLLPEKYWDASSLGLAVTVTPVPVAHRNREYMSEDQA